MIFRSEFPRRGSQIFYPATNYFKYFLQHCFNYLLLFPGESKCTPVDKGIFDRKVETMEKTDRITGMRPAYQVKWDAIGIGASLACAVHCVLLPVIFTTFSLFGIEILENTFLEVLTVSVSMTAGGWAIWKGYMRLHRQKAVLVYFAAGLLLMIGGNFVNIVPLEMALKISGAILLITAHIRNWRGCRDCEAHTSSIA